MAENSKIEWCDHTFNPWMGCTKVSPGCAHCYAEVSTPVRARRGQGVELWGPGAKRQRTKTWSEPVRWNREAKQFVKAVGEMGCPRVFCASLADWLDDEVPIEWLADLLKLIHETPNLDWLLLTKRPENWRMRMFLANGHLAYGGDLEKFEKCPGMQAAFMIADWLKGKPPENVWLGTTVENQEMADQRIPELLKIPARVRFLSCEPLLGTVDLAIAPHELSQLLHWVICGGESGRKKRAMDLAWARSLRDQCAAAGVPFFMKQIDKVQPIPDDLMIREFPRMSA
jgi:protein gp37